MSAKGKLPEDFPHRAELEAAGVTTYAGVRKLGGDYKDISGVGASRGAEIDEALAAADTESGDVTTDAADDSNPLGVTDQDKVDAVTDTDRDGSGPAAQENARIGGHFVDPGAAGAGVSPRTGAAELEAQAEATSPGVKEAKDSALGELLTKSRYCFYDDPAGPYIGNADETRIEGSPRIQVRPIAMTVPKRGTEVRDGEDVYVITEDMQGENPSDWLKVRSPNSGLALIR